MKEEMDDIPKTAEEIARRIIVLTAVIGVAQGGSSEKALDWLEKEGLSEEITPDESKFLSGNGTERDKINFSWKVEALVPLLWAIKKLDAFPNLTGQVDTSLLAKQLVFPPNTTADFVRSAILRKEYEISEMYETVYQSHWEVRDAHLNGKEIPNGFEPGVVMERHYGFNWLIGYCGQEWDGITTDT